MPIPTVRRCLCFDLRFGSLIIACVELAYAVVGLLDGIQLAATANPNTRPSSVTSFAAAKSDGSDYPFLLGERRSIRQYMRMYVWLHLAETFGLLVVASLLVHGIRMKRRSLFIPWLGIHFVATVIFGALAVIVPLGALVEFGTELTGMGLAAGIFCLFTFTVNAYVSIVVYSHYRELGQARDRNIVNAAPVEIEVYMPAEQFPPSYDEIMKSKEVAPPAVNP